MLARPITYCSRYYNVSSKYINVFWNSTLLSKIIINYRLAKLDLTYALYIFIERVKGLDYFLMKIFETIIKSFDWFIVIILSLVQIVKLNYAYLIIVFVILIKSFLFSTSFMDNFLELVELNLYLRIQNISLSPLYYYIRIFYFPTISKNKFTLIMFFGTAFILGLGGFISSCFSCFIPDPQPDLEPNPDSDGDSSASVLSNHVQDLDMDTQIESEAEEVEEEFEIDYSLTNNTWIALQRKIAAMFPSSISGAGAQVDEGLNSTTPDSDSVSLPDLYPDNNSSINAESLNPDNLAWNNQDDLFRTVRSLDVATARNIEARFDTINSEPITFIPDIEYIQDNAWRPASSSLIVNASEGENNLIEDDEDSFEKEAQIFNQILIDDIQ